MVRALGLAFMLSVFALSGVGMVSLVTAAVTQGQPADFEPKYNRTASIHVKATGELARDLGGHAQNPFPGKAACEAGIPGDLVDIAAYIQAYGLNPADFEIRIVCKLVGDPA